ncbi:MAG: Stp1/IreP family PP2C-type Ser/Thr phosphatase [Eubacterium sp.]|jgi:Serine/threonine protein phosphatase|nr:Stp1/IreP family PP2C-type Ser/Thr phosphatase [Eubacterium sp.]
MKVSSMTNIGRNREMNEDFLFVSKTPVGNLPNLFIVADGMGGHNAGEYASRRSVEIITDELMRSQEKSPEKLLEQAVQKANSAILEAAQNDPSKQGMGTTIVALSLIKEKACVANVGDSRLYILEETIRQVTQDHSLVAEMVRKGELEKSQANDHPDKNIITRAVGVAPKLKVDYFERELHLGSYVLMCSDGLTNMVGDEDILEIVNRADTLEEGTEKLVETANENGGKDNITVILIEPFN